jgi:hypothetical protein
MNSMNSRLGDEAARRDRIANAVGWAVFLLCRDGAVDLRQCAEAAVAALDTLHPAEGWSQIFRSNPAQLVAAHASECSGFLDALEASPDEKIHGYAADAYLRADAMSQQSAAEMVFAAGAGVALIIAAVRFKMITIEPNRISISAYKPDKTSSDIVKAAAGLLAAVLAPLTKMSGTIPSKPE